MHFATKIIIWGVLRVPPFEETPIYNPFIKKGLLFWGEKRGIGEKPFLSTQSGKKAGHLSER